MTTDDVTSAGSVECSECGHAIERHDTKGCALGWGRSTPIDGLCACRVRWTKKDIIKTRRLNGLPAVYNPWELP